MNAYQNHSIFAYQSYNGSACYIQWENPSYEWGREVNNQPNSSEAEKTECRKRNNAVVETRQLIKLTRLHPQPFGRILSERLSHQDWMYWLRGHTAERSERDVDHRTDTSGKTCDAQNFIAYNKNRTPVPMPDILEGYLPTIFLINLVITGFAGFVIETPPKHVLR